VSVPEAPLERTEHGLRAAGEGWFVINAREAAWLGEDTFGHGVMFEGATEFPQVGINIQVLFPGQPNCYYHGEEAQEGFLVLAGECLLLVEGQERLMRAWDYVHLPPWTEHVLVGAGDGPCTVLGLGARGEDKQGLVYPVSELALRHGAGVEQEAHRGEDAYAGIERAQPHAYREGFLPDHDHDRQP
jgi:uncharacterized cupin superfamily protein